MQKRTTTANEVRHRNYKYGEDRIKPNFNMAESSKKMNIKRGHSINKKKLKEATVMNHTSCYSTNFSDGINPKSVQMFFNEWK